MSFVKKRSADTLQKAAKGMMKYNSTNDPSPVRISRNRNVCDDPQNIQNEHEIEVRIVENKRVNKTPEYIKLSPSEFMNWWITATGANRKASNILLKYLKFKFDVDIPKDFRTLLDTPAKPVPKYLTLGSYVHLEFDRH